MRQRAVRPAPRRTMVSARRKMVKGSGSDREGRRGSDRGAGRLTQSPVSGQGTKQRNGPGESWGRSFAHDRIVATRLDIDFAILASTKGGDGGYTRALAGIGLTVWLLTFKAVRNRDGQYGRR
jgi:hypothetical protein